MRQVIERIVMPHAAVMEMALSIVGECRAPAPLQLRGEVTGNATFNVNFKVDMSLDL